MRSVRRMPALAAVILLAAVLGLPWAGAAADPGSGGGWLVLQGGQRIETRSYEIRDRQVLFEDAAGRLRSLRLSEVDLEATRRAAEEPTEAAADISGERETSASRPEPEPVLVLDMKNTPTQEDAERSRTRRAAAERKRAIDQQNVSAMRAAGQRRTLSKLAGKGGLATVEHWSVAPSRQTGGLQLMGALRNSSDRFLDRVEIRVQLFDEDGKKVGESRGYVDQTRLRPGAGSNFHWIDPGRESLDGLRVEFLVTARALSWGAKPKYAANTIPEFPFAATRGDKP